MLNAEILAETVAEQADWYSVLIRANSRWCWVRFGTRLRSGVAEWCRVGVTCDRIRNA